ncbi:Copper-transporting ATPase 2 [Fusarium oxysporum f. sp. cubense race 1]|uniref:Copper-transporting ATPase 2 n=1 Tax=Fusarium oxysporum f. sp. cubense (strain race 1) TaxID=1229664 RepID=N4U0A1_FUSC1|nr:Copper-transporting ATPase 2 [Fusarium oxysporum f. sp. cubense race 1]
MACCAVGAYIVFRFINIHEKLCALYPRQSYVDHAPTQRPKPVKGAQVRILSLDGLTCASCVSDVQDIIKTIPGVLKATVSLGLLRAQVEFNNHLVTEGEIIDAIRSAGYDAHSLPSSDSQSWASLLSMIQEPTNSQQHHVNSCQRDFLVATAASTGINRSYRMDLKSLEAIPILSTSVLGGRLLKTILSRRDRVFASPLSSLVPAITMVCNKTDEHASIPIDLLSPCDSVIVSQGEHIPCDGVVESTASALILETWINGSLEPRTVKRNDAVYAGGQVQQGSLVCRATACGRSTRLGELLTSVVAAELANSEPQLHLGASKFGVRLLTTYARLRSAASAQTIFFDKTGTLTHGDLKIIHASFSKEWETLEKQEILWRAVHEVEAGITHPVARALFQESYSKLGEKPGYLSTILVSEIKYELGRGAQAVVTATQPGSESTTWKLAIGSRTYIESPGVSVDLSQTPVKMRTGVTTTVVLAMDGKQAAVFALEDTVRSDAQKVISQLKDLGLTIGMITGDNAASATSVARELGIDSDMIFANALPEEKSCILARFLQRGSAIYIGDNYNDILCFASASFSICVASSEMQSIDSDCADGTLMISEASPLSRIPLMILLARPCVLGVGGISPPSPNGAQQCRSALEQLKGR